MSEIFTNIELDELAYIENIDARAYNICKYNDLDDLEKILQYFFENGNFKKFRNCGNRTDKELREICNKYKYSIKNPEIKAPENELTEIIEKLTIKQKAVLNNIVSTKYKYLTLKSSNALGNYLDNIITIKNLNKYCFSNTRFEISTLKNIGIKASEEINLFFKEIKEVIAHVSVFENEDDLARELFYKLIIEQFSVNQETIDKIGENYDFSNGIPVFKTINILIKDNYILNKNEKIIFQQSLGFFTNRNPSTLTKTANEIGLTRERARQIKNKLLDNFQKNFSFLGLCEKDFFNFYNLDITALFLNINQNFIDKLNKNELVDYNVFFINRILSIILNENYSLIGNEEKGVLDKNSRNHHNWNSTYLISNQIQSIFDFEKLINDVRIRLSEKTEEDYKFHFQTYLLNFKKGDCFVFLDEISQIAEQILYNELEIIIDIDDNITFAKNNIKTISDYIYDTLTKAKKPLSIYEIWDILNYQSPSVLKNVQALRSSCQRDVRLICFGRSSTYGLKIWENKLENIKGGTMHDISEEFLLKFKEPKHIAEIAKYVSNYRNNVTSKNLLYNLKSAEHKRFIFFQNNFIGLVAKSYNTEIFTSIPKYYSNKKTWEESYQLLELFTSKNKRLPLSSGDKEEIRLYRFFTNQERKLSELSNSKKELIENLMLKYNHQKRTTTNNMKWKNHYNELISFLNNNKRMPSRQISNEQKLYGFFYRQKKLYKKDKLAKAYLTNFLEVTKIIKILKDE